MAYPPNPQRSFVIQSITAARSAGSFMPGNAMRLPGLAADYAGPTRDVLPRKRVR